MDRSHSRCHAVTSRDTGSTSCEMRSCDGPREMYDTAWGRHCHAGSVWIEATQAMARSRAASFMGIPTQSPSSVFPVLSSSRTGVHSPERSMPRAVVFTSSCCAWLRSPPAPNSGAASTPARINARAISCIRSPLLWRGAHFSNRHRGGGEHRENKPQRHRESLCLDVFVAELSSARSCRLCDGEHRENKSQTETVSVSLCLHG